VSERTYIVVCYGAEEGDADHSKTFRQGEDARFKAALAFCLELRRKGMYEEITAYQMRGDEVQGYWHLHDERDEFAEFEERDG
jgi:hypothetical protein